MKKIVHRWRKIRLKQAFALMDKGSVDDDKRRVTRIERRIKMIARYMVARVSGLMNRARCCYKILSDVNVWKKYHER